MLHRLLVVLVGLVLLGSAVPVFDAGASAPPGVACGQTITASVVLHVDLTCSGDGLTIAASSVTVQLHGHTITSTSGTGAGIRILLPLAPGGVPCPDDVVIRGGTISGFATAIDALCSPLGGSGNRISAMRLIDNEWGIASQQIALDVDHTTIEGTNGIGSRSSGELRLRRLRIDVTGTSVQSAGTSMPTTIDASRLTGGTLETDLNSTTVSRSVLDGVTIECFTAALALSDTRVVGGGGIWGQECANDLVRDRFSGPGSGTAVSDAGSEPWTITDSRFTGWDLAIALGGDPSTITSNVFRRNGAGVICATGQCAGVSGTVSGNWFIDNRGAGLSLSDGTWHVGSNRAERNGGLGIDAEGPDLTVIDDGGNIARRNQPPQCVGVVCAT